MDLKKTEEIYEQLLDEIKNSKMDSKESVIMIRNAKIIADIISQEESSRLKWDSDYARTLFDEKRFEAEKDAREREFQAKMEAEQKRFEAEQDARERELQAKMEAEQKRFELEQTYRAEIEAQKSKGDWKKFLINIGVGVASGFITRRFLYRMHVSNINFEKENVWRSPTVREWKSFNRMKL